MRAKREVYLPKHPKETEADYEIRLQNSYLVPYLDDTINTLVGRAFSQPWTVDSRLPDAWIEDIDLAGNHLEQFARSAFDDSLAYGLTHILVDLPPRRGDVPVTLADDRQQGRRPYLTHIPARNLIAWRSEVIGGKDTLTHLRYKEVVDVPDGRWATRKVERIRVLEPGTWEVWEGDTLINAGETGLPYIPLVTHYSRRVGFMTAVPPLENLGYLNQRHWVSASDQNHILHICRVPIIQGSGLTDTDEIVISPNSFVRLPVGAELKYVVMDSGGIEAGYRDLERLEMQCRILGMQPLALSAGDRTATEASINNANTHTSLRAMVIGLKDALELALAYMADLAGQPVENGGTLQVNLDFGVKGDPLEVQNLILLYERGVITGPTLLAEAKRRGLLNDDVVPSDEYEAARLGGGVGQLLGEPLDLGQERGQ
ncbi:DUF4055 domain-containing protein [Azospirillum baldaniorum]|nr:DUF4055 domain-containing protein [Azospirillum baldaniorum]